MIRGMFLKIVLWFWASLMLVALALHAAVIATSTPTEVRVQRFSDTALAGYGRRAVSILESQGLQTHQVHASSETIAPNLVISQQPAPGQRVPRDTIVTLTVSTGTRKWSGY